MEKFLKQAKILVVDDQQANIDVISGFLEMQEYENVVTETDPRKVFTIVREFNPDIILLDLSMPFMSGFEVMEKIKKNIALNTYLPILILTADITIESKRKALLSGASDFLTKPFDLIELQARLNTHLQIKFNNEQINRYNEQLEKLIAIKDKFFSIIAHDLRNPFVGIENFTQILLKIGKYDPDEFRSQLETINSTAVQGHQLLENLLRWSRSQTDTIVINSDVLDLNESINNCLQIIHTQAENKEVKVINSVTDGIYIDTDKDLLETILRNIISNAVKYTPQNGQVLINASANENQVEITISDNGVGIPPETVEKLFRIDRNLQTTRGTSGEKGSGLGLILCKEFTDLLGGNIQVKSEPGNGSVFTVTLPGIVN